MPVLLATLEGEVVWVNDALSALVGLPAQSLVGLALMELGQDDQDDQDEAAWSNVLAQAQAGQAGGDLTCVWRQPARGGGRHVRVAWSRLQDPGSGVVHVLAVCLDDTSRAQAERRAGDADARWRAALATTADVTWTATPERRLVAVSGAGVHRLGWDHLTLQDAAVDEIVHPDDAGMFFAAWDRLLDDRTHQEVLQRRLPRHDGSWTWVQETLTDRRDDAGVAGVVGSVIDLTGRRQAEVERVRHEERFRARFTLSHLAQTIVGPDGRLTDVNDAFCQLLGRTREQLIGLPMTAVGHDDDVRIRWERDLSSLLAGERTELQVEGTLAGPDAEPLPVLLEATLLRDEHGEPDGAATFLRDLSPLRYAEQRQRQQEELFLALNQRASDLSLVTDRGGQILYVSPAASRVLGHAEGRLVAEPVRDLVHPEDLGLAADAQARVLDSGGSADMTLRVRAHDGTWRWMHAVITNMTDTPVGGLVSNMRDITAEVQARQDLEASEARYRAIVNTAQEGIWATAADGSTLYANECLAGMLGVTLADLYERPDELRDLVRGAATLAGPVPMTPGQALRCEVRHESLNGGRRTLSIASSALYTDAGVFLGTLVMASDVTDARRLEEELRHAALHDSLTDLPNRALLLDRLDRSLARHRDRTAVLFVDLDHFKLVNDSRGHSVGDDVLVAVADRFTRTLRPRDTVARFGGDEFVVVCEDVDEELARALAEELAAALRQPLPLRAGSVHLSASIGLAMSPAESAEDLLRYADTAMYAAKAAGRRRVRVFDPALTEQAEDRFALSADLPQALAEGGLSMHYQPILDLTTGAVAGIEGLARWTHPRQGSVPPARFVPIAEDLGLAPELDRWAVQRGLRDAAALRDSGALPQGAYVAINLSARNLADRALEDFVIRCAEQSALSPADVVLEVTESAVMEDTDIAVQLLGRLRARGFGIALDDFGTGFSSLAYLRDLPITSLKIDRSFVRSIAEDQDALGIVTAVVDLARAVGADVVAEGVETSEQAQLLVALSCRRAQGWLWSPALPLDDLWGGELRRVRDVGPGVAPVLPSRASRRDGSPAVGDEHGLVELLELHRSGASLSTIAAALNRSGFTTPAGTRWHRNTVARVISDHLLGTGRGSGTSGDPGAQ